MGGCMITLNSKAKINFFLVFSNEEKYILIFSLALRQIGSSKLHFFRILAHYMVVACGQCHCIEFYLKNSDSS